MTVQKVLNLQELEEQVNQLPIEDLVKLLQLVTTRVSEVVTAKLQSGVVVDAQGRRIEPIRLGSDYSWWNDPSEDIYTLEDGEPFNPND